MGVTTLAFGVGVMTVTGVVAQADAPVEVTAEQPVVKTATDADVTSDSETTDPETSDSDATTTETPATTAPTSVVASVEPSSQTQTDAPAATTPQADTPQTDSSSTQGTATQTEEVTAGTVTTPTQVVKAPNQVTTTSDPTIDPQTHTDVPETNTYQDSIFHQVPIYLDGELANPTGQDAIIDGKPEGNDIGGISVSDYIAPQHENEIIKNSWYDGKNAWMVGFSTDNQTAYVYELDQQGQIINTLTTLGPDATDFDNTWTTKADDATISWEDQLLKLTVAGNFATTNGLTYLENIPVKYVDTAGNQIAPDGSISGYDGTYVDAPVQTIPGYRLVSVPYQNEKHQFLINDNAGSTPSDDFHVVDLGGGLTEYYKVLDVQNTQDIYLVLNYAGVDYQTPTFTMAADPNANSLLIVKMAGMTATIGISSPTPIGDPLTFVYEPIQSYQLMIQYLDADTHEPLATTYQATGIGDYEIKSPVIAGYTVSASTITGNLLADTLVNVFYSPVVVDEPTTPTGGNEPGPTIDTTPTTNTPETTVVETPTQPEPTIAKTPTTPTVSTPTIVSDDPSKATATPEKTTDNDVVTADASYAKAATTQQAQLGTLNRQHQTITATLTAANQTTQQKATESQLPQTSETNSTVWAQLGIMTLSTLSALGLVVRKKRN